LSNLDGLTKIISSCHEPLHGDKHWMQDKPTSTQIVKVAVGV